MADFIANVTSFPTVFFTVLLGFVLLYWLMVILGALDIDSFDVGGMLDGADGALDGAAHGVGEAAGEAAAHAAGHIIDGEHVHGLSHAAQFLSIFGLRGIPCTISMSLVIMTAWGACATLMHFMRSGLPDGWLFWLLALAIWTGAVFFGLVVTSAVLHPLKGKFKGVEGRSNLSFVGMTCCVATSSVDSEFGQATLDDKEGHSLLIQVRCTDEHEFKKGSLALIYEYDLAREVYWIVPHEDS